MTSEHPVCMGPCCLSQDFFNNFNENISKIELDYRYKPNLHLNIPELLVLDLTYQTWRSFEELGNHTDDDIREFKDAIHRLQQIIALRLARRADPSVWRQPDQ